MKCFNCKNKINIFDNRCENCNNKNYLRDLLFGFFIGVNLLIIFLLISYFSEDFYFNNNKMLTSENHFIDKDGYYTIVKHDNFYKAVNIKNKDMAYKLIIQDSLKQKNNCNSEIKKIEDDIINNYGIKAVNFCEMNLDLANEVKEVFKVIYDEYPLARGYLTNATLRNYSEDDEEVIASFNPTTFFASSDTISSYPWVYKTQIFLNASYFLNSKKLENAVINSGRSGYFPPNTTRYSFVAHELGHYLSFVSLINSYKEKNISFVKKNDYKKLYKIINDFNNGKFAREILIEAFNNYKIDYKDNILSFDQWRATISLYAVSKDENGKYIYDESIAEAFHDYFLNKDSASLASKYIVSVLKNKLS